MIINTTTLSMTRSMRKTWPPYIIRYPSPARDEMNSPTMTPTSVRLMLTFTEAMMVGTLAGIMTLVSIWALVAPKVLSSLMRLGSTSRNPVYTIIMVTMTDMDRAIPYMDRVSPSQT